MKHKKKKNKSFKKNYCATETAEINAVAMMKKGTKREAEREKKNRKTFNLNYSIFLFSICDYLTTPPMYPSSEFMNMKIYVKLKQTEQKK
jgi:hypothetical protein